jgi:hypothetical protein
VLKSVLPQILLWHPLLESAGLDVTIKLSKPMPTCLMAIRHPGKLFRVKVKTQIMFN